MTFNEYCASVGLTIRSTQTGYAKPGSKNVNEYRCTLSFGGTPLSSGGKVAVFYYTCGSAYSKWRKDVNSQQCEFDDWYMYCNFEKPAVETLVSCLISDTQAGSQLFVDFCADFGYDVDSIAAHKVYNDCQANAVKWNSLRIPADVLAKLQEYSAEY